MEGRRFYRKCALPALPRLLALVAVACSRNPTSLSPPTDASGILELSLRVPAALSIARAIDTLSVATDPSSLGLTQVPAHAGSVIGIDAEVLVFRAGEANVPPLLDVHTVRSGVNFTTSSATWTTERDGVPAPGTKYIVEMQFVLFETDVLPTPDWNPHTGRFKPLWTRTLRQAEE